MQWLEVEAEKKKHQQYMEYRLKLYQQRCAASGGCGYVYTTLCPKFYRLTEEVGCVSAGVLLVPRGGISLGFPGSFYSPVLTAIPR